jgi:hypothetical protein
MFLLLTKNIYIFVSKAQRKQDVEEIRNLHPNKVFIN